MPLFEYSNSLVIPTFAPIAATHCCSPTVVQEHAVPSILKNLDPVEQSRQWDREWVVEVPSKTCEPLMRNTMVDVLPVLPPNHFRSVGRQNRPTLTNLQLINVAAAPTVTSRTYLQFNEIHLKLEI